jgi:two-component system CheB/CheR fusion protein
MKKDEVDGEAQRARVYIEILAEMAREPFLILDKNLNVVDANNSFLKTFRVTKNETEGHFVFDLGNKQWNIPKLRELLENILPKRKFFEGFEVEHNFPIIGKRTMVLNAQEVDSAQLIILCFEDITAKKGVEREALKYIKGLESEVAKRTKTLQDKVKDLEELTQVMVGRELKMSELKKEIARIRKLKKLNGNGSNNRNSTKP